MTDTLPSDTTVDKASEPKPTYIKLAMRNMVRKKGKSLTHFFLSASGLMALLIGISYLTR
jgi:hypothetical protein